jgi:O-antigen/teichoic acid export membrane protein
MPRKAFKDLSANSVQVILNQGLGIIIFYITSRYLSKEIFGELNWSLATASLLISTAGAGIDLMILRKIAGGENVRENAGLFFIHSLFSGLILASLLVLVYLLTPAVYALHILLPGIMISQIFSFFSSPYKQITNGKRLFRQLALISIISNAVKVLLLVVFLILGILSTRNLVLLFIIGSVAELLTGFLLTWKSPGTTMFPLYWNREKYIRLVKKSLPQFGVTVFNVVLARFDWFILGILTTTAITAEYSFAYKVFELCRLPLLALSPVLIPVFVRIFNKEAVVGSRTLLKLNLLFRIEMIISVLLPVLLASCWTPLVNSITRHKYGAGNEHVFWVLGICVPLQFATDYYWNMCFAQNQLRLTFLIAVISGIINIGLNIALIPTFGAMGAAWAYIACFIIQLIIFKIYTRQDKVKPDLLLLFKALLCACAALFITKQFIYHPVAAFFAVISLYLLFGIITRLIVPQKIKTLGKWLLGK